MSSAAGEVLRGMGLEPLPVRIGRKIPATNHCLAEKGGTGSSPEEEAVRRGYEAGRQQGHADGAHRGYEEGLRQGAEDAALHSRRSLEEAAVKADATLKEELGRLRAIAGELQAAMDECLAAAEDELVALCFETVCRIVAADALKPEVVRQHLGHVMSRVASGHCFAIHVHPHDAELMAHCGTGKGEGPAVRWVSDPEVALGGCLVVQRGAGLDARLETALAECKAALLSQRARNAVHEEPRQ